MGVDDTYPPMEYRDEKGNLVGYDIDVAEEIESASTRKSNFADSLVGYIYRSQLGKYDCIISSLSITEESENHSLYAPVYCQ